MTLGMGKPAPQCVAVPEDYDELYPPSLVGSSPSNSESDCSSVCSDDSYQFLIDHHDHDRPSDGESSEDKSSESPPDACSRCAACSLPMWSRGRNPKRSHSRNFCSFSRNGKPDSSRLHHDAPTFSEQANTPLTACSLLPPDIAEILESAKRPVNQKKS